MGYGCVKVKESKVPAYPIPGLLTHDPSQHEKNVNWASLQVEVCILLSGLQDAIL